VRALCTHALLRFDGGAMTLFLRDDVFLCVVNRRVALLDLAADRYFALPDSLDHAVQASLQTPASIDLEVLSPLLKRGLLLQEGRDDRILAPTLYTPVARDLQKCLPRPTIWHTFHALLSHAITALRFKCLDLRAVLAPLRRPCHPISIAVAPPSGNAARALASFLATRRFLTAEDQCLKWSYALILHLARTGYRPNLVIGVRLVPFSMHAWVQAGDTVLNDNIDLVAPYSPILVI
jgi:hypothetical protein